MSPTTFCSPKTKGIAHGDKVQHTRFEMEQLAYFESDNGYIEVLTLENAPGRRWRILLHEHVLRGTSTFSEWSTEEAALAAFQHLQEHGSHEAFLKLPGFKRQVKCGSLTPWFYALAGEEIIGDYVRHPPTIREY